MTVAESDLKIWREPSGSGPSPIEALYPYEMPDFHQCWWRALSPRFDIPVKNRDLLVFRRRLFKGLLTMREVRIAGWNAAWSQDLTVDRVEELEELARSTAWDYCRLTYSESRAGFQALDRLEESGYLLFRQPAPIQYVIDLQDGFEAYLQSLSHNGRKGLKKKVRRAEPLNPKWVALTDASDIEPFFEAFFPLHRAYWDEKAGDSYFNCPEERHFIVEWAKRLHQSGYLILDKVTMNDETVNLSMGLRLQDTFYWLLTINTGRYAEAAPGLVALYLRACELAEQGVKRFNMGAGDYFYKVQSANSRELCHDLIIVNPSSMRGRIWLDWMKRHRK